MYMQTKAISLADYITLEYVNKQDNGPEHSAEVQRGCAMIANTKTLCPYRSLIFQTMSKVGSNI